MPAGDDERGSGAGGVSALTWDAGLYDRSFGFVSAYGAPLVELLDPQPGERILDLGCGTGQLAAEIAARGAEVIGLDASPEMIEQARRSYPQLRFMVGDAADFRLAAPCDAVFSNAVIHWVPDHEGVARAVAGALKPGGRFVAEFGGRGNVAALIGALRAALAEAGEGRRGARIPWTFPGIAEFSARLERHGLEPLSAVLFDRPTRLEQGEAGLRLWLAMFTDDLFAGLTDSARGAIVAGVEARLRYALFHDGAWWADYRRLRIVARKPLDAPLAAE